MTLPLCHLQAPKAQPAAGLLPSIVRQRRATGSTSGSGRCSHAATLCDAPMSRSAAQPAARQLRRAVCTDQSTGARKRWTAWVRCEVVGVRRGNDLRLDPRSSRVICLSSPTLRNSETEPLLGEARAACSTLHAQPTSRHLVSANTLRVLLE